MNYNNLDTVDAFSKLKKQKVTDIKAALTKDRVESYMINAGGGFSYNYAAMPVDDHIIDILQDLCEEQELVAKYKSLLGGSVINLGEKRQVLHQLLRGSVLSQKVMVDGEDKGLFYANVNQKIASFSEKIRNGEIKGSTGKPFTTICQIGIGGSDLGPRALYLALKGYCTGTNLKQLKANSSAMWTLMTRQRCFLT